MAKLLIVDDENDVREFAANFFRKRKIDVTTAPSGEEALKLLETMKPDLILMDIKMEGMDGIETLRRLRERDKHVKVIMVTGKKPDEENSHSKCSELGILNYINKPLELDELENVVLKELNP
jgi:DNA-binding response OmpR family regulator